MSHGFARDFFIWIGAVAAGGETFFTEEAFPAGDGKRHDYPVAHH